jgi:hypothetical protein
MAEIINLPPPPEASEEEWRQFFQDIEFDPLIKGDDNDPTVKIKAPPSNEEWDESRENDLPTVRMAFACLLMPKDKLTEFAGEMMAEDEHSFEEFGEAIKRIQRNFEGLAKMLDMAAHRLVAAAYCALPPPDGDGGGITAAA